MTTTVDQLVRAVLYEGYALYPYRPSALKNQRRFAFGAIYPRAWAERTGDPWIMRAECVLDAQLDDAGVAIVIRFLVLHRGGGATEHAIELAPHALTEAWWREARTIEPEHEAAVTLWLQLDIAIVDAGDGLWRVAVEIENRTPPVESATSHEDAMDATLASTHVVFRATGATAISTIDPPERAAAVVAACRTLGTYPVVVARDTVLASPIVLPDFPELAPQSPGDFFDGTEIDEMLTLRVLTMTDAEKREAAAADPRIAQLIDRTESLGIEATARLHGATRTRPVMTLGTRVRLRPTRRADAFDIMLAGKLATIAAVERDLDGRIHCAVTIDDDPGADLGAAGMPGHRFYFAPDELEVVE